MALRVELGDLEQFDPGWSWALGSYKTLVGGSTSAGNGMGRGEVRAHEEAFICGSISLEKGTFGQHQTCSKIYCWMSLIFC